MHSIDKDRRIESRAWKTLFFVSLINSAQASLSIIGIPAHAKQVGLDPSQLSLLLGALPIGAGIAASCTGSISDYLGRKKMLIIGLLVLGISLSLHGLTSSFPALMVMRAIAGFATGVLMGLPSTLLSDSFHKKRQQSLTGKALCGYAIGQTIGIPTGIALMEWTSFLTLCSCIGILALLTIPFAQYYLPAPQTKPESEGRKWLSTYFKQTKIALRRVQFAGLAGASFLSFTALSLFYVTFALWLFETVHLRPTEIAPMYLGAGVLQVLVFLYVVQLFSKVHVRVTIAISLFLNTVLFATAYAALESVPKAAILFALTLGAVSLRIPGLQFLVNNSGDPKRKGLRMSIVQTCSHLGKATGSVAASILFSRMDVHQIILICGGLTFICSLIFLFPSPLRKRDAQTSAPIAEKQEEQLGDLSRRTKRKWLWHAGC